MARIDGDGRAPSRFTALSLSSTVLLLVWIFLVMITIILIILVFVDAVYAHYGKDVDQDVFGCHECSFSMTMEFDIFDYI